MTNEHLNELCDAWRDSQLTEEQAEELNQLLRESEDARREFADQARFHGLLHSAAAEEAIEQVAVPSTLKPTRAGWSRSAIALCAFAAGLAVVAIPLWPDSTSIKPMEFDPSIRVAEVRYADGAKFASTPTVNPSREIAVGSRLGPGVYKLERGFVELDFFGGAVLAFQAPVEFELQSQREARLQSGRLTLEAGDSGEPFLLHTPAGEVVDIGTRYGVFVDKEGVVETHVFEGLVDIRPTSTDIVRRVEANSAVRINLAGGLESLSVDKSTFPELSREVNDILRAGGFEVGTILTVGDTTDAGIWHGDVCRIVRAQDTVSPFAGNGMLLFQSTGHSQSAGKTLASQLLQWVDLSPWRDAIAEGRVQAKLSARFNRVAGDAETDSQFSIQLESFEVQPAEARRLLSTGRLARSRTSHQLISDSNPKSWEKVEAMLTLPPNSQCLQVMILAFENVVNDDEMGVELDGHFADDLKFQLVIDPVSGASK